MWGKLHKLYELQDKILDGMLQFYKWDRASLVLAGGFLKILL